MTTATLIPQGDDTHVPFPPAPSPSITSEEFGQFIVLADEREAICQEALGINQQIALLMKRRAELVIRYRGIDAALADLDEREAA